MSTQFTVRALIAVAAADRASANSIAEAQGLGPDNFSTGLIRLDDLDSRTPRAYLVNIQLKPAQAIALRDAFVAAGIEARGARVVLDHYKPDRARPTLAEFLAARGWRLKPTGGP